MGIEALLGKQWYYTRLAHRLAGLGSGTRSVTMLAALSVFILIKGHSPWRDRPWKLNIHVGGRAFDVWLATRTELEVVREIFLEHEYAIAGDRRPMTILDLGAHIGLASIYMTTRFPNARIIAIEADPQLIPRLKANVHGLPVEVIHAAVSRRGGKRNFYRGDETWSNSIEPTRHGQQVVEVPAITVDQILDRCGVDRVDLMKIDVEGAEWEVFAGGVPSRVDAVIGEVHRNGGRAPGELLDQLAPAMRVSTRRTGANRVTFVAQRCADAGGCVCGWLPQSPPAQARSEAA
ncbi:MAG: FkbM family methyltransferase [Solirubrobacterales bacterium]